MRRFLAGLILLVISQAAFGQISGFVESIGFNNAYRPDCFTPMIVQIKPTAGSGGLYYIQVKQLDLQGDEVTFTRPISVTGDESSGAQRFSMYFLPTPSGLPDSTQSLRDLQKELKVFLVDKSGKQVASLPLTSTLINVDPPRGPWNSHRGRHFVLSIAGNGSKPAWGEWQEEESLLGVNEDAFVVQMSVRDLPENPIAYDSVDTIVWCNVDPADLKRGDDYKFRALQDFVRRGGHLVICQSAQWEEYSEFGDLLPVNLLGIDSKKDLQPLHAMSGWNGYRPVIDQKTNKPGRVEDPWESIQGPFTVARAEAKPGAVVDQWVQWDDKGADRTPYIVRKAYGLGAVTWVAQDLGDTSITSYTQKGWANIWDRVFGWNDTPLTVDQYTPENDKYRLARGNIIDMGRGYVDPSNLNLTGTVSSLVALAVAFFIIYWVVAGPGVFAYLVNRRRQNLSWFGFTIAAMIATLVTVLIVRLVVRGPPQLAHSSFILQAPNEPARVRSDIGLYIKRDGVQHIELAEALPGSISTLTPMPEHSDYLANQASDTTSAIEYQVPVRDLATDVEEAPALDIYYRNTAKKFQANWIGKPAGKIDGVVKLADQKLLDGVLTNGTGVALSDVYFAFNFPNEDKGTDWLFWMKRWEPGVSIDLAREFYMNDKGERVAPPPNRQNNIRPNAGSTERLKATMRFWQDELWNPMLRGKSSGVGEDHIDDPADTFVLASFFDRLLPLQNDQPDAQTRVDLWRRGARHLDRSASLEAGALVIIARSPGDAPIPIPLKVEGDNIAGPGPICYQFVLPLDRSAVEKAATQPAKE
jgi:hypothetical protein